MAHIAGMCQTESHGWPAYRLLHSTAETQDQVERGLLLDVVIGERAPILQLLACENETLLIGGNTLFVLNLCFDIIDRVTRLDIKRDGLARQGLHEDLHASTQAQDQVERGLLLDVVVGKCAPILQLLACENEALLI